MIVDSGASTTVVSDGMVKAVDAVNVKPGVSYQMADGSNIPHMGEKAFGAYTDAGLFRSMTAQVTEVNKALLSVSRMVKAGNRVVFDEEGSYVEHKASGEWIPLAEQNGLYMLKMWVPKDESSPN